MKHSSIVSPKGTLDFSSLNLILCISFLVPSCQMASTRLLQIDARRIGNKTLQTYTDFIVSGLNSYFSASHPEQHFNVQSGTYVNTSDPQEPFHLNAVFVDHSSTTESLMLEARQAAIYLSLGIIGQMSLLASDPEYGRLDKAGINHLDFHIGNFINSHSGMKLTDPFIMARGIEDPHPLSIQGAIKERVMHETVDKPISGLARVDGYIESSNSVYLILRDDKKFLKKPTVFKCANPIFFRLVAEAKLSNSLVNFDGIITISAHSKSTYSLTSLFLYQQDDEVNRFTLEMPE